MVMNHSFPSVGVSQEIFFAGDDVRLAGQLDYPSTRQSSEGYPLIFVIQHATCNARADYAHVIKLGTEAGAAVFTWDKRGTGASGSGASGSGTNDTLRAYEKAVSSPSIDAKRVIIFAQNEGTLLLKEAYKEFKAIQAPLGIILGGNMLDEQAILSIDAALHIIVSKNDWNDWHIYAEAAADAHTAAYRYPASFYVATNTDRRLMLTGGSSFHRGAKESIQYWLKHTCQISA